MFMSWHRLFESFALIIVCRLIFSRSLTNLERIFEYGKSIAFFIRKPSISFRARRRFTVFKYIEDTDYRFLGLRGNGGFNSFRVFYYNLKLRETYFYPTVITMSKIIKK